MYGHLIKYFDNPDEVREFPKGRFEVVTVNGTRYIREVEPRSPKRWRTPWRTSGSRSWRCT